MFDITSDTSVDIPENTPLGKKVAVVLGRDKDAGLNGLVRMQKKDGNTWTHSDSITKYLIMSSHVLSQYLQYTTVTIDHD